jgi:hypothetical protein
MLTVLKYLGAFAGCAAVAVTIAFAADPVAKPAQDKHALTVPGGLAFSEFKGYEKLAGHFHQSQWAEARLDPWQPAMINAYKAGIPGNGKQFPDGAKMAKIHWIRRRTLLSPVHRCSPIPNRTSISW